jgi:hypothetical protein
MPTGYYLLNPEEVEVGKGIKGPFDSAAERDAAQHDPSWLPLELATDPHKENPNNECLLLLVGSEHQGLEVVGPFINEAERAIDLEGYFRDGADYAISVNIRRNAIASAVFMSADRLEVDEDPFEFASDKDVEDASEFDRIIDLHAIDRLLAEAEEELKIENQLRKETKQAGIKRVSHDDLEQDEYDELDEDEY